MIKLALAAAAVSGTVLASAGMTTSASEAKETRETARGFVIHDRESAPESTREVLDWYTENFQFVPNLAGVMAESPALLRSYWGTQINLQQIGGLTPAEDNIVQLAIAVENECQYCVAGHTMAGKVFFNSTDDQLQALRVKADLPEAKFNALRDFAVAVNTSQGRISESQLREFYAAGYTRQHALDVVANIAAKVMSNYTNQIVLTPVDEPFQPLTEGLPFKEDRKLISR